MLIATGRPPSIASTPDDVAAVWARGVSEQVGSPARFPTHAVITADE